MSVHKILIILLRKDALNLSSDCKNIYDDTKEKHYVLFIKESSNKIIAVSMKILGSTTVYNIDNNQHIRMISEGSRDTEHWSNGCWNFSFESHV